MRLRHLFLTMFLVACGDGKYPPLVEIPVPTADMTASPDLTQAPSPDLATAPITDISVVGGDMGQAQADLASAPDLALAPADMTSCNTGTMCMCSGHCVDLMNDDSNCGSCNSSCGSLHCNSGRCS